LRTLHPSGRDVTQKSCPGPIAYARLDELNTLTRHYETHGLQEEPPDMTPEQEAKLDQIVQYVERSHPSGDIKRDGVWATPTYWRVADTALGVATLLGRGEVDVDEAAIAAQVAQLLTPTIPTLSDADLARIADAVADEQANRLSS